MVDESGPQADGPEPAKEWLLDEKPGEPGRDVGGPGVADTSYNPAKDREKKRGQIAMLLVWLLVGIVFGTFALTFGKALCVDAENTTICGPLNVVEVRTMIEMLLTPVVALVGAVTGFYFGESKG